MCGEYRGEDVEDSGEEEVLVSFFFFLAMFLGVRGVGCVRANAGLCRASSLGMMSEEEKKEQRMEDIRELLS